MKSWRWVGAVAIVTAVYVVIVALIGFEGTTAIAIHFARVALAVAVLILYLPAVASIFVQVPPPGRDYLLAGIILTWSSAICFAIWNEVGQRFDFDRSIFTSPIAGFFSLLLVLGGVFHMLAPNIDSKRGANWMAHQRKWMALAFGVAAATAIVFLAPLL